MKYYLVFSTLTMMISLSALAQNVPGDQIEKIYPVNKGQKINMKFDYPELVKVTTWDKDEIAVHADVNINDGENNEAFILESNVSGNVVNITSRIKDMDNIPHRITVWDGGKRISFINKDALNKYQTEQGRKFNNVSYGVQINIVVEIFVPRNVETRVESVYGVVEVKSFDGPLDVEATYGAVDASVKEKSVGEVIAETNYGEIFTNLNAKFSGDFPDHQFYTFVKATPGSGPKYALESKYGNVYIRRAEN